MALRSISRPNSPAAGLQRARGFTIVELLIVIALAATLLSLALFMSMDVFRGTAFRSTEQVLVSALTLARSRALANEAQQPWSVCYDAPDFVVYRGATYSATDPVNDRIPGNASVSLSSPSGFFTCVSGAASGVTFAQLTGDSAANGAIAVSEAGHPDSSVSVNAQGAIIW